MARESQEGVGWRAQAEGWGRGALAMAGGEALGPVPAALDLIEAEATQRGGEGPAGVPAHEPMLAQCRSFTKAGTADDCIWVQCCR